MSAAVLRPAPVTRARVVRTALLALAGALVACAAALLLGAEPVDVPAVLAGGGTDTERTILLSLRLPRVLAGALVGAALGASGVAFQALLRNPLAEPYLLGLAGGGSLGAVLAIVVGVPVAAALGIASAGAGDFVPLRVLGALVGCLGSLGAVWTIASRGGALRPASLLLAGVVVNAFALAGLACAQFLANPHQAQSILRWLLGGLESAGSGETLALAVVVPLGIAGVASTAPALHALVFGEETAQFLGIDVLRTRRTAFLAASLLTAACVAVAGPVGFVGLVVPHGMRLLVGADPRLLLPAAVGAGAAFLPLADAAARTAFAPREMPVGVVTALLGAPAFLLLVLRRRGGEEALRV
jgi:iron complex transport system permease protein